MEVQVLGAHLAEQRGARLTSLLVDGVLAVDAGGLTSALSLADQQKVETVLLTHPHFDHTRDLVTLAANAGYYWRKQVVVYAQRYTLDVVTACLLDGRIYTSFLDYPSTEEPTLILETIQPYDRKTIAGQALRARRRVPNHLFRWKNMFYTSDTTVGLADCWRHIAPQLLITEVAGPNKYGDWLKKAGHFCADFLKEELVQFRQISGYLPRIVVIRLGNPYEKEIEQEVAQVAQELEADISLGHEDMKVTV